MNVYSPLKNKVPLQVPLHLLAWPWLWAAIFLFTAATYLAWQQGPRPVPADHGQLPYSFLQFPNESNPHRRLPRFDADLIAVESSEDGKKILVHSNESTFSSLDGGVTWLKDKINQPLSQQKLKGEIPLQEITEGKNSAQTWVNHLFYPLDWVNLRPPILLLNQKLTKKFVDSQPPVSRFQLQIDALHIKDAVYALHINADGQHAWFIGDKGNIMATEDSGKTWSEQTRFQSKTLLAIHFPSDNKIGYVVGAQGLVLKTTDGGKSWLPLTVGAQSRLHAVHFLRDGIRGWAVGDHGLILASENSGASWHKQETNVDSEFRSIVINEEDKQIQVSGIDGSVFTKKFDEPKWSLSSNFLVKLREEKSDKDSVPSQQPNLNLDLSRFTFISPPFLIEKFIKEIHFEVDGNTSTLYISDNQECCNFLPIRKENSVGSLSSLQFSNDKQRKQNWGLFDFSEVFWLSRRSNSGILAKTDDGGDTWKTLGNKHGLQFRNFHFDADTQHGWAVTANSSTDLSISAANLVATTDGGVSWKSQQIPTDVQLIAVHINADKNRGWAVGEDGIILSTKDGGVHWDYAEHYSRSPANWYWLVVAISLWFIWLSWHFRPSPLPTETGMASNGISDAPITVAEEDRLGFSGLARGISRYLRNAETLPPLTLAITGDWGSGKSSLMQLVSTDLRRHSHRAIWFNAWHNQKEEQLFANLLGAVYAQAAPRRLTTSGLIFRTRLLWLRSKRHFLFMIVSMVIASYLLAISWQNIYDEGTNGLPQFLMNISDLAKNGNKSPGIIAAFSSAFITLFSLFHGTRIFSANPATLLKELGEKMSLKAATEKNDFRTEFSRQFKELTEALPCRLVIVIDDLDRCRSGAVLEIMEAVNYLTSAGDCIVLFGMAKERVQATLCQAFKEAADEMAALTKNNSITDLIEVRRTYVNDYLQKLINIEIRVPTPEDEEFNDFLKPEIAKQDRQVLAFLQQLGSMWPLFVSALAITLGLCLAQNSFTSGTSMQEKPGKTMTDSKPVPVAASAFVAASDSGPKPDTTTKASKTEKNIRHKEEFVTGESDSPIAKFGWTVLALLPLLATLAWILVSILKNNIKNTNDSDDFTKALSIWSRVVANKRKTPRFVKRFGNRLRYLAMLQQGEQEDKSFYDELKDEYLRLMKKWLASSSEETHSDPPLPKKKVLSEPQLVAIGAIHEIDLEDWQHRLNGDLDLKLGYDGQTEDEKAFSHIVEEAIQEHTKAFNCTWPPTGEEIAVFKRLISGVRLGGDPEIISQGAQKDRAPNPKEMDSKKTKGSGQRKSTNTKKAPSKIFNFTVPK